MIQFKLAANNAGMVLYVAQDITSSVPYWFAYISFFPGEPVQDTVTLEDIWNNMVLSQNGKPPGDFIFAKDAPADPDLFLTNLETYLSGCRNGFAIGYYIWIEDISATFEKGLGIQSMLSFGLSSGMNPVPIILDNKGAENQINFENIYLGIPATVGIGLDTDNDTFSFNSQNLCQPSSPSVSCMSLHADAGDSYMYGIKQTVSIPLSGKAAFTLCFPFTMTIKGGNLQNDLSTLDVAIKYFYPEASPGTMLMQKSYPVFGLPADGSSQMICTVSLDPLYPLDITRTSFLFPSSPSLISGFTTDMGHEIILTSDGQTAGIAFVLEKTWSEIDKKQVTSYYLAPFGNYYLSLTTGDTTVQPKLMCGMSATEDLGFVPSSNVYEGDRLVFYPNQNAYSPFFPIPPNNGSLPPIAATELLNNTYLTSWVNILSTLTGSDKNNYYYSQPPSSPLFAKGSTAQSSSFLWFFEPTSRDLSSGNTDFCFPIVPYASLLPSVDPDDFTPTDLIQFENQILFPTRKNILSSSNGMGLQRRSRPTLMEGEENISTIATTPQGLLATVGSQGEYMRIQLASNIDEGINYSLELENVTTKLTDALQTNQLFMVATNSSNIGTLWSPPGQKPAGAAFENFMSIEEWPFVLNVGKNCAYGDYANVLIFKFCPGKLVDLVSHPEQWTQPLDFINSGEVQAVAGWLLTYINNSIEQYELEITNGVTNGFYANFNSIINDSRWNGILCLKVDISLTSFPEQLQGLLAGIDLSKFNAHHFGININQVTGTGGLQMEPCSSLFGLIDYEDPAYTKQQQQNPGSTAPVQPQAGQVYDFKVLNLKVLFENTQVADFSSIVQVTINNLFGDNVKLPDKDDNPSFNSIVLNGTFQDYNNTPVYIFDTSGENPYLTGGNVLTEVEVVKVQFNTLVNQDNVNVNMVNSRFSIWGYLHFAQLPASMDIFSYGDDGVNLLNKGLYFSNLYIDMSFDVRTPAAKSMVFDAAQIAFDPQQSYARPASLCALFPLTVTGFVTGDSLNTPSSMNYLKVNMPQVPAGSLGNLWNGLVFNFNMGSPGALASEMGFSSSFLMAWAPGSKGTGSYKIAAGIQLPGTAGIGNMMGIEGVLKLAIDAVQLNYAQATDSSPAGYLLMLNNIALKFLGILQLPPGGSTNCYVFGSPAANGKSNDLAWYAVYVGPNGPNGKGSSTSKKQLT